MALALQPSACSATTAALRSLRSGISWLGGKRRTNLKGIGSCSRTRRTVLRSGRLPKRT